MKYDLIAKNKLYINYNNSIKLVHNKMECTIKKKRKNKLKQ